MVGGCFLWQQVGVRNKSQMCGSTVGVAAPSSACLFVKISLVNLGFPYQNESTPVRLRQGAHLRWQNKKKQVKRQKQNKSNLKNKSCSATV